MVTFPTVRAPLGLLAVLDAIFPLRTMPPSSAQRVVFDFSDLPPIVCAAHESNIS